MPIVQLTTLHRQGRQPTPGRTRDIDRDQMHDFAVVTQVAMSVAVAATFPYRGEWGSTGVVGRCAGSGRCESTWSGRANRPLLVVVLVVGNLRAVVASDSAWSPVLAVLAYALAAAGLAALVRTLLPPFLEGYRQAGDDPPDRAPIPASGAQTLPPSAGQSPPSS